MRLPEEVQVAFHTGPAEVVVDNDAFAVSQQLVHQIGADEAGTAEYNDRLSRARNCKLHDGRLLQVRRAARLHKPPQQLGTSIRIGDSHVIVPRVEVQTLLDGDRSRNILPAVPVEPLRGGAHRLAEPLNLLRLITTPCRVACLGNPDLRLSVVLSEHGTHLREMLAIAAPTVGLAVPGTRKAVKTDCRNGRQQSALPHQSQPMRVERRGTAKHRLPATVLNPMRCGNDHLAEQQPIRIGAPIPVEQIIRFVPQFDITEVVAVPRQHMIDEISVVLQTLRCTRRSSGARDRWWRVVDAWQQIEGTTKCWN